MVSGPIRGCQGTPSVGEKGAGHPLHGVEGLPPIEPDTVKLDRSPNNHAAFGLSVHRCIGAQLGRLEFEVVLKTVLERIPEYRIDRERAHRYPSYGLATGWSTLPTTFTPGTPTGDGKIPSLEHV